MPTNYVSEWSTRTVTLAEIKARLGSFLDGQTDVLAAYLRDPVSAISSCHIFSPSLPMRLSLTRQILGLGAPCGPSVARHRAM